MTLESLIVTHGYWVLAVGCFLEGETILLMAGMAANRGYLDPVAVISLAALTGWAGDQFYFWLGRHQGARLLERWPELARHAGSLRRVIGSHPGKVIVGVRFAYGLRIAGPVLIGMSPVSALRFTVLNAIGAVLWALLIGGAGWLFGHAAQALLGEVQHLEGWLLLALAATGAAVWSIRRLWVR